MRRKQLFMANEISAFIRREKFALVALLVLIVLIWLPRFNGPLDLRWDGGVYYILGTSLAQGKGYRLLNEPGEIKANQYPPLLPAIIAAHQLLLGTSDPTLVGRWLRLTWFLIFIAYILSVYYFLRSYLITRYAFLGTTICLFNLFTYFLSDLCFPEILFALATVLFFIFNRYPRMKGAPALSYLCALASYALRTIGVATFAAWIAASFLKREFKKTFILLGLSLIPILCWQSYVKRVEAEQSYQHPYYEYQRADYMFYNVSYARNISLRDPFVPEKGHLTFANAVRRFAHNLIRSPTSIGETVSIKKPAWDYSLEFLTESRFVSQIMSLMSAVALLLFGCIVFSGLALHLGRGELLIPLYILIYLMGVCSTPFPEQFTRYLAPIAPYLILLLLEFLIFFKNLSVKKFPPSINHAGAIFAALIISVIFFQQLIGGYRVYEREHQRVAYIDQNNRLVAYRMFFYGDSYKNLDVALDWLKPQISARDIIASSMPHWVYLRTGAKAVMPPFESDPTRAQHLLDTVPVNYLITDQGALDLNSYTNSVVQRYPERWQLIYSTDQGRFTIHRRTGL